MADSWRLLAMTAALQLGLWAGDASAQTIYLRNAAPGTRVEVVVDTAASGTGVVDEAGEAKVAFRLPDARTEMDANIFVDACDKLRRVLVVDRARQPPPPAEGCERREISGIFWVRPVNTIVINLADPDPSLLLVKGSYTPPTPEAEAAAESGEDHPTPPLPKGLVMFAGGSFASFRDAFNLSCGTAPSCSGGGSGPGTPSAPRSG